MSDTNTVEQPTNTPEASEANKSALDTSALTELADRVEQLSKNQESILGSLKDLSAPSDPYARSLPGGPQPAPHARRGEDPMSSRGYSYLKLFGFLGGTLSRDDVKIEAELSNKLGKEYDGLGYRKHDANSILAPVSAKLMSQHSGIDGNLSAEVDQVVKAGVAGYDPYEARQIASRYNKTLSWVDESQGAALVAPPLLGDLIELLRVNEALMAAGARTLAMPPNGRITFPRQTDAATAYWVGESQSIIDSTPTTGALNLSAKKLGLLIKIPNELFRFASLSVEQFVRDDIARVASIEMDKALLEGPGTATRPKGLITYDNIVAHTARTTGTNGDTFEPEDVLDFIAKVEENNAVFRTFIMRPLMFAALANRRADATSTGDKKGPFVFNLIRGLADDENVDRMRVGKLAGYDVVKSTNISQARSKGSASNLSYILGGDFNDFIIAMSGVIEFALSTQGDSPFVQDQTWVRGINYCDGGPRHEASFILCDQLVVA